MTQENAAETTREETGLDERPPVIESASATTDPANAESGPFAYVVSALAVLLLVLLVSGFTGCAASVGRFALESGAGAYDTVYPQRHEYEDDYADDIEDFFDDVYDLLDRTDSRLSVACDSWGARR